MASSTSTSRGQDFVDFLNASPTPYHAVHSMKGRLEKAGFKQIKERDSWAATLKPSGKYYLTRNGSTIVAFAIGQKWRPGNSFSMIGAHTDSCCLRMKPVSKKQGDGFLQIGVETYGGGLWHTWFDRDLALAGRVLAQNAAGKIESKLFKIDKPLLRIPTLAIHFGRQDDFNFNKETQLFPITGMVAAELERQVKAGMPQEEKKTDEKASSEESTTSLKPMTQRHHAYVLEKIADAAGVKPEDIVDFEAMLYDTQKACLGGLNDELVFGARLDNLGMTYCATEGLIDSVANDSLSTDPTIRVIACFDHEEVGSQSAQGADSSMLLAVLKRLSSIPASALDSPKSEDSYEKVHGSSDTTLEQSLATSFLISADMAHSVNPNYGGKYESDHRPEMNKGTVLKINANQRYMTNSPGIVLLQRVAEKGGSKAIPLQLWVIRNDSPCGSTIGPMLAASLGARTLDLGNPQLSMHSIRETSGAYDVDHAIKLFDSFFVNYNSLSEQILVDE